MSNRIQLNKTLTVNLMNNSEKDTINSKKDKLANLFLNVWLYAAFIILVWGLVSTILPFFSPNEIFRDFFAKLDINQHFGIVYSLFSVIMLGVISEFYVLNKKIDSENTSCKLNSNVFFKDIIRTVDLINDRNCCFFPAKKFAFKAGLTRSNAQSSENVLPLTQLTYDYFKGSKWFELEAEHQEGRQIYERVVIIDTNLEELFDKVREKEFNNNTGPISEPDQIDAKEILDFLRTKENFAWYIKFQTELKKDNEIRLFRNFSVFKMKEKWHEGEYVAYFTYLDKDHLTLFTKGAWAQYKTTDPEYIAYLRADYKKLKMSSKPIANWLEEWGENAKRTES